ncbi:penicillin acylase family protein, partial [Micromonospora azadirachtae]
MTRPSVRLGAAVAALGLIVTGLGTAPAGAHQRDRGYSAEIRRASYGVPHITAANFASLGFGVGHVQAEDNICVIAETAVTVNGERSRWFGASGPTDANVRSDLFYRKAMADRTVERMLDGRRDGVHAPSDEIRDLVRGFAAGYNSYLREIGVAKLTDPACRGRAWVRPLTELDVWRTSWASMVRAGSAAMLDGIVAAAPPDAT